MLNNSALKAKKSKFFLLVIGVFFLIFYATSFSFPTKKTPIRFYSTHSRDDLRLILFKAIKQAQSSIHIYTYALTDPQILSLLMQKARAGIPVHITYHQKNTPKLELLPHLYLHPEKGRGLMHAKWLIIDEVLTFLGTANLTSSSLIMHENFLMGLYAPDFAKALITPSFYQGTIGNQTLTFYHLPATDGLKHLLDVLEKAKKDVQVAMFTLTHPLLVQKLIHLHQRGTSVRVILDQTGVRGASKKAAESFLKANLPIQMNNGLPLFHHKWALIDSSIFVLGSANWTQGAFNKNRDFILFLSPLNKFQIKYLNKINKIIKKESFNCK